MYLSIFHDVLHVDAHLVHGAGNFFDGRGRLHANFGGFIGGTGNLIRTGGNLSGGIASGAHDFLQTVGHAAESVAQGVALRTRNNLDAQIAFGNRHGNGSHFLEVSDKVVESSGESADLIVAMNVNVLIEVAGVADLACHGDEMGKRKNDGPGGVVGNQDAKQNRQKGARGAEDKAPVTGFVGRFGRFVKSLGDLGCGLIENR